MMYGNQLLETTQARLLDYQREAEKTAVGKSSLSSRPPGRHIQFFDRWQKQAQHEEEKNGRTVRKLLAVR